MSTKTTKRKQKRLNTDEDSTEMTDKSISPKKIIEEQILKEVDEVQNNETEAKAEITGEQNGHKIEENGQNGDHHEEKNGVCEETSGKTLDEAEKSNIVQEIETPITVDSDNESDIQLSIDDTQENTQDIKTQENDTKLQEKDTKTQEKDIKTQETASKSQEKDTKLNEKSPVLTGRTTRSQKSPKIDKTETTTENGIDTKITNELRINVTRIEEEKPTENKEVIKNPEEETKNQLDESVKSEEIKEDEKDTTNASIFVNLGNDTTRNIDITTTLEITDSFIDKNKDISYGQALRTLSGRRTLRRDSPYVTRFGKTNLEKDTTDARKSYVPHISSVKRKGMGDTPEDTKRFKSDESPGLFSYISSPITSFRNKLTRSEIPSSTPKLMSYNKYAPNCNIIQEMSDIDLADSEKVETKKWCSIM